MDIYLKRIAQLRHSFSESKIDALLVSKPENIFYLSGFRGDDSYLLITERERIILSDSRYEAELHLEMKGWRILIRSKTVSLSALVNEVIVKKNIACLGFDPAHISYFQFKMLSKTLSAKKFKPCYRLIETIRLIKDADEIVKIKEATKIAQEALYIIEAANLKEGHTEKEIADYLEYTMRTAGAEKASFPTIVAAGRRSAFPHAVSGNTKIRKNSIVLVDFGAKKGGYSSDLTRTFFLGKITPRFRKVYTLVRQAQSLAISTIKAGIPIGAVDKEVRQFFKKNKCDSYFTHALGHGIGLEVHESPSLLYTATDLLKENMVVTIEPGLYFNDWGGVRIEDMVRVTRDGCEVLSSFPYLME
jgi:Xaa-Pro aminopeptidase